MYTPKKIGLIAGSGDVPERLVERWIADGYTPVVADIDSHVFQPDIVHARFSVGQAGHIVSFFKAHDVRDIVIIGGLKRPNLWTLRADAYGIYLIFQLVWRSMGDDSLLKFVRQALESKGLSVQAAQTYLPELLCPEGVHSLVKPDDDDLANIQSGLLAAKDHGAADKGQAIILCDGHVMAREGKEGTNTLIRSVQNRQGRKILVKASKPQQDMALDAPTIGVSTIENLHRNGFKGLVVEAERTLVLDKEDVIRLCNTYGLFFMGIREGAK